MAKETPKKRAKASPARITAKPTLLAGGNPQIAKGDGDAPVQSYIAVMPGWKRDVGRRLDALITGAVPDVQKAVKWNSPFYGIEGQGWFLSFHCFTKYVKVAFFDGASLRPSPPIESKHEKVRYFHILSLLTTAIMLLHNTFAYGQVADVDSTVRALVDDFIRSTPAVGLSIGIIEDGAPRTYHFGEVEKGRGQRPTDSTLYAIGSVSKTFAATLLAQAVVDGKVRLEDDVRKYLDGDYPNLEYQGHPIQLSHLVNHNSGLPFMLPVMDDVSFDADTDSETARTLRERRTLQGYTRQDFLEDLRRVELKSIPGSQFQYSNGATQLLGYLLERVYGKPYERLVETRITGPLMMRNTKFVLSSSEANRFKGYNGEGVIVPNNSDYMPTAGGVKSSVLDMLKYVHWHLNETDEAIRLTHTPTWNNGSTYSIGLNWQMFQLPAYRMMWQEGSLPGYSSYCVMFPELKLGIVALMNEFDSATSSQLTALAKALAKALDARVTELP